MVLGVVNRLNLEIRIIRREEEEGAILVLLIAVGTVAVSDC
jgi:hypothetical protein